MRQGLRIDLLGPLAVTLEGQPLDVGPSMVRCLLALLSLRAGQTVSRDEIIRVLWEEEPPTTCVNLIQGYVSRLRGALRAVPSAKPETVVRQGSGYRLEVAPGVLDLETFDQAGAAAQRVRDTDDPAGAMRLCERALAVWRGPALADLPAQLQVHPVAVAAMERRIDLAVRYADLCLRQGEPSRAAQRLTEVISDVGLHEGLSARLMLAYTANGDRVRALTLYEQIRRRLADELGVDPSGQLRDAHLRVLREQVPTTVAETSRPVRQAPADDRAADDDPPDVLDSGPPVPPRRFRTRWWLIGGALVLAPALAAGFLFRHSGGAPMDCVTASAPQVAEFTTDTRGDWVAGPELGQATGNEQWASARYSGVADGDHNAGFLLHASPDRAVKAAITGVGWKVEDDGGPGGIEGGLFGGPARIPSAGLLQVAESTSGLVTITVDGRTVGRAQLPGRPPGRAITPTIWQDSNGAVRMTEIRSSLGPGCAARP